MKQFLIAGAGCAVTLALLSGCSTQDSKSTETTTPGATSAPGATDTAAAGAPGGTAGPAENNVKFGDTDAGPITAVTCQSDGAVMTITVAGSQQTTMVLTDEDTPAVKSVSIGEAGSEGPSLMFLEGVSETPQAARDGKRFTVNGTVLGANPDDPTTPVDMPFEIAVNCP